MHKEVEYTAKVKRIRDGTSVNAGGHRDTFVMVNMVGDTITVKKARDEKTEKPWTGWYEDADGWYFHRSWLTFPK